MYFIFFLPYISSDFPSVCTPSTPCSLQLPCASIVPCFEFVSREEMSQNKRGEMHDARVVICAGMKGSVFPWTYSYGDPIKTLVCLSVLEPMATACHVGQNCFDCVSYSTSSELAVLVTLSIPPRRSWLVCLRLVLAFYLVGVGHGAC